MGKISRSFRLDESVLKKLDEIQLHLQTRLDTASEISLSKAKKASNTQTIEFAINYAFEKLKEDGYV